VTSESQYTAAWLRERRGAIEVGPAPYTPPRENEITVKNHAVANFGYVKGLAASQAFDYHDDAVAGDIVAALKGKRLAGALAIGAGSHGPACRPRR
jgi:hypothetical protein